MCKGQLHIRDMYWFLRILSFGMLFLLYREHIYTGVTMVTKKHALWGSIKASFPVILLCTVDVSHQSFQFRQLKRDYLWLRRAQPFSSHLQNPDFFFFLPEVSLLAYSKMNIMISSHESSSESNTVSALPLLWHYIKIWFLSVHAIYFSVWHYPLTPIIPLLFVLSFIVPT